MSRPITDYIDIDDAIDLYVNKKISMNQIAKELGVARITLCRHFTKRGIPIRGASEAETIKWSRND
jgi:predicted HTH domain antitoxin